MVNEEFKVIECSVDDFEKKLNEFSALSWELADWRLDFSKRSITAIFVRDFSVESCSWIDKLNMTIDRLSDLRNEDRE